MSLDLYQDEARQKLSSMPPVSSPEAGAFDGFIRGAGLATMRGFARAGSAIDLMGSIGPIAEDAIFGTGTEAQDRYFKEHEDTFGSASKYWTPEPNEVGVAGEVVGSLLSTLPLVITSPSLAVATTQIGTAEELVDKGVSAGKAEAVGAVQGLGMGLGVWMPILGQNGWQRVVVGGAGFNAAQGIALRGTSGAILDGTPAGDEFKAFDGKAMTLDVLLGMAFGSLSHLSPGQRAQGAQYWERLTDWAQKMDPSQVDSVAALRQAQHLNVDSVPGKLETTSDIQAHVDRMRTAVDQLAKGEQLAVDDMPAAKFEPDDARASASEKRLDDLQKIAEKVRTQEGIAPITAYHGTGFDFGDTYTAEGLGPHFGTIEQANAVAEDHRILGNAPNVRPVDLELKNPLRLDDRGIDNAALLAKQLEEKGILPKGRADQLGASMFDKKLDGTEAFGEMRDAIKKAGYDSVVYANKYEGKGDSYIPLWPEQIRSQFSKSEVPAANRGGIEPPPPRGPSEEAAGTTDPVMSAAEKVVAERPDLTLRVGTDANGEPVTMSAKKFLEDARAGTAKAKEDTKLYQLAAQCLLGVA